MKRIIIMAVTAALTLFMMPFIAAPSVHASVILSPSGSRFVDIWINSDVNTGEIHVYNAGDNGGIIPVTFLSEGGEEQAYIDASEAYIFIVNPGDITHKEIIQATYEDNFTVSYDVTWTDGLQDFSGIVSNISLSCEERSGQLADVVFAAPVYDWAGPLAPPWEYAIDDGFPQGELVFPDNFYSEMEEGGHTASLYIGGQYIETVDFTLTVCSGSAPTYVNVPYTPSVNDPCGVDNATWIVPDDDETFEWSVSPDGVLTVNIIVPNTLFESGASYYVYGVAPDSQMACAPLAVTPKAPTQSSNIVTIPSVPGVAYLVADSFVTGELILTENITVSAHPKPGYVFTNGAVTSWSFIYTKPATLIKSAVLKVIKKPTSHKAGQATFTIRSVTGQKVTGTAMLIIKKGKVTKKVKFTLKKTATTVKVPKLKKGIWKFQVQYLGNKDFAAKNTKIYKVRVAK
ncbi:MAG: hypothetical protein ACSLEY_01805 [Candidatus Saccharimonadales bacterium]